MKKIAVATSDDKVINAHFGRTPKFLVFSLEKDKICFLEERANEPGCSNLIEPKGTMEETIGRIKDCDYVLVHQIGKPMIKQLEEVGVIGLKRPGFIQDALEELQKELN